MKKLLHSFGLAIAIAGALAGCDLYFGDKGHSNDNWNYCAADGYYTCKGDSCVWVSATCPAGGGGSGYSCTSNSNCASGCYCSASGVCTEGGFCTKDADCGPGYHCDPSRSSCEPNTPPSTCQYDNQCPQGQYCSPQTNTCTATCTCTTDQQAIAGGFGWCDVSRMTCLPGQNPAGTCAGDASSTCTTAPPSCPPGQVGLLLDGCWTGQCHDIATCNLPPVCTHLNDEPDCLSRTDCSAVYNGLNCKKPDGTICHSGDTNCTCAQYVFASCAKKGAARTVDTTGAPIDSMTTSAAQ